jgi:uncharacterized protein (TIGR02453 family)
MVLHPRSFLTRYTPKDKSRMELTSNFQGFPVQCVEFFRQLALNNNKSWFDEHRPDFEKQVMDPARAFVFEMGRLLATLSPKINADPRVDKSIFRLYRDTRFRKDKTPYKTHLGIFFWEGKLPKMESSGFYFHLEPPTLFLGCGIHCFSPRLLESYRNSVVDPKSGPILAKSAQKLSKKPDYTIGGKHYKKAPRGYTAEGVLADLLLHNGLFVGYEAPIPDELYSSAILDYCLARFKEMAAIHKWLVEMTERVG